MKCAEAAVEAARRNYDVAYQQFELYSIHRRYHLRWKSVSRCNAGTCAAAAGDRTASVERFDAAIEPITLVALVPVLSNI